MIYSNLFWKYHTSQIVSRKTLARTQSTEAHSLILSTSPDKAVIVRCQSNKITDFKGLVTKRWNKIRTMKEMTPGRLAQFFRCHRKISQCQAALRWLYSQSRGRTRAVKALRVQSQQLFQEVRKREGIGNKDLLDWLKQVQHYLLKKPLTGY